MRRVRSLGFALALVATGCGGGAAGTLTVAERVAAADSVRLLLDSLAAWFSTQGAGRAFTSFYDSAPGFVQAADGRITSPSFDALALRYRDWVPPAGARFIWDTVRIEVLGAGLAHFTGAFTEGFTPPSGASYEGHGVMSGVAVRRPGGWKIAAVHTSVVPQAEP